MGMSSGNNVRAGTVVYSTDYAPADGSPAGITVRAAADSANERLLLFEASDGTDISWVDGMCRIVIPFTNRFFTESIGKYANDALAVSPIAFTEDTAPAAVANKCVVWAEDNGSGKTRLMARFGSGADQQLAIEP